jgi:L-ribulose-5-phosphate 4-epimerase
VTAGLDALRRQVCEANLRLVRDGLVILTWGNASAVDRARGLVVIKPSGVAYDDMRPEHMVAVSLETGEPAGGTLRPSSDTATHVALYRAFAGIGGIVHTHSLHATAWAQAARDLPAFGTTHADYFHGPVPCTRAMTEQEIAADYEGNTGAVIVERFATLDPLAMPAVLVAHHAPFTWGATVAKAVENALVLEYTARLASETLRANPAASEMPRALLDKHFLRKHGPGAYYGQR